MAKATENYTLTGSRCRRDESSRLEKKWNFKDILGARSHKVRVSHKNWILTVFTPDWSLNYISMCRENSGSSCLKTTTKGRKQEFYEIGLHGAKSVLDCLLTVLYLQIMYSLGSSDLVLWLPHQGTESEAGSAVENLNKERVSFKSHQDM